jgi:uncharacterized protein with von Willebrand factor type A (vWA) domain
VADDPTFVATLVDFARVLRAAGLPVGPGDVVGYCAAVERLNPADLLDVYWAGRATLTSRPEHLPVYDQEFRRFFLGQGDTLPEPLRPTARSRREAEAVLTVPETEPGDEQQLDRALLGLVASGADSLRTKSFSACTPEELAAVRRIMSQVRLVPPRRRTRRTVPTTGSRGARPDLRRTVRESLRIEGESAELRWRVRRNKQRRLILLLDVSGSMADYSRHLLQFAYSARRAATRVEVFCFGTRLTRITKELDHRRPDEALDRAAAAVADWDGGTRIGDALEQFVRLWARRGLCRGGIVVICSDGLDRGDPAVLAAAMERLSRLCHRIVWVSPHLGPRRDPDTLALRAAEPFVDALLPGGDLASLEQFAVALPALG